MNLVLHISPNSPSWRPLSSKLQRTLRCLQLRHVILQAAEPLRFDVRQHSEYMKALASGLAGLSFATANTPTRAREMATYPAKLHYDVDWHNCRCHM